jgi:hypothetical protein
MHVFKGKKAKTRGGLCADDIVKVQVGSGHFRYRSKKRSAQGKKNKWSMAFKQARQELGVQGFVPLKKGTELYTKTRAIYEKLQS